MVPRNFKPLVILIIVILGLFKIPKIVYGAVCGVPAEAWDYWDGYRGFGVVGRPITLWASGFFSPGERVQERYVDFGKGWIPTTWVYFIDEGEWGSIEILRKEFTLDKAENYTVGAKWIYIDAQGKRNELVCTTCVKVFDYRENKNLGIEKLVYTNQQVTKNRKIQGRGKYLGLVEPCSPDYYWHPCLGKMRGNNNGYYPTPEKFPDGKWWNGYGWYWNYSREGVMTVGSWGGVGISGAWKSFPPFLGLNALPSYIDYIFVSPIFASGEGRGAWAEYDLTTLLIYSRDVPGDPNCRGGVQRSTPSEGCPTSFLISDDSYTDVENPNTNYGGSDVIRTQKWSAMVAKKGFIKFDLSTISSAEVVDKAKLRLWVDGWGGTGGEIGIYRVTGDWNEGGITWNNSPSVDGNVWASTSVGNLGYWEWDITQLVKYWLANPGSNKGLMVQANTSNTSWYISSSENSEENARPCLKIDYTSAPTLTPTPTSSPTPTPPPTPISGVVFIDRDKDGKKDADEGCFEGEVNFYSDLGRLGSFTSHASCNSYLFYVPSGATQIYIYPPPEGYMFSSWTMTDSEGNICFGSGGSCFYSTGCR